MKTKLVKLSFLTNIHYGNFGSPGLLKTDKYITSDTLYSAFCDISPTNIEKLLTLVNEGKILISDALPYVKDDLLVPIPAQGIKIKEDLEINRTLYKKLKKVEFIPLADYSKLVSEATDSLIEKTINLNNQIGIDEQRTINRVSRGISDTVPIVMSTFHFYENSGLYVLIQYKDETDLNFILNLIKNLGYFGVGGKRSSGLGKYEIKSITDFKNNDEGSYILVSTSLPIDLDEDVYFKVLKRSGFYRGKDNFYKKRDVYAVKSGLLLEKPFKGVILDDLSEHDTIYRFLVPMFLRVKLWKKKYIKLH